MRKQEKNPRLLAGAVAFLLGALLFIPAALGIILLTSPKDAGTGSWETLTEVRKAGSDPKILVFKKQDLLQYQLANQRWYSLTLDGHSTQFLSNARNMDDARTYMLMAAGGILILLAPATAASVTALNVKKKAPAAIPPAPVTPKAPIPPKRDPAPLPEPPSQPKEEDPYFAGIIMKPAAVHEKTVTFNSIAGYAATKRDMEFVVKCLRSPDLLRQVGAKVPAGILLYGPPGTGKTLMAKAIAGTAGVRFYSANASEFIRRYVGVGAENVQALYREARANAPSIVFIDEIDAIGGVRGGEGENQEYRQTLNALLTEMDGLSKDSGVMTIAATNDFEHLDPALIRPGRFDRKIAVPLPNYDDRLEIIKLYASQRNVSPQAFLETLARDTAGLAGSGISTLFNEAALHAVMCNRGVILPEDVDAALTQIVTNGVEAKTANPEELRTNAYHEAGHAVILRLLAGIAVSKVSIVGTTSGAAGTTFFAEDESTTHYTTKYLRNRIVAVYGGRAAEELVFGREQVTAGARDDLKTATRWIKEFLQGGLGNNLLDPEVFASICGSQAEEARTLSEELYQEAMTFLTRHRDALDRVANALLEKGAVTEAELEALL